MIPDPANAHTLDGVVSYSPTAPRGSDAFDVCCRTARCAERRNGVLSTWRPAFLPVARGTYSLELNIPKKAWAESSINYKPGHSRFIPVPPGNSSPSNRIGPTQRIGQNRNQGHAGEKRDFSETYQGDEKSIRIPLKGHEAKGNIIYRCMPRGKPFTRKIEIVNEGPRALVILAVCLGLVPGACPGPGLG